MGIYPNSVFNFEMSVLSKSFDLDGNLLFKNSNKLPNFEFTHNISSNDFGETIFELTSIYIYDHF